MMILLNNGIFLGPSLNIPVDLFGAEKKRTM